MLVTVFLTVLAAAALSLSEAHMVCYYGSWAVYRNGKGKFDVEDIDPFLCTHLVWGFAGLGSDNKIKVLDPYNELCRDYGQCGFIRFTALKKQNPALKTNLAVGGWNEGSKKYSEMAKDPAKRATFVQSCIELLKEYRFDGMDLDWEYPTQRGGAPEDKANFVILLQELLDALHAENMMLSIAVSAGKATIDEAYDVPAVSNAVDFIYLMAYDLHGSWETHTHHHTILYPYPQDQGDDKYLNVDFAVQYWLKLGAPKDKFHLGTATYGRCWRLDSQDNHGMYAPASQPSSQGPYTEEPGYLGYNEICEHNMKHAWTQVHEEDMNEPYAYDFNYNNAWCGYDDPASLTVKGQYAAENGLAGIMVWSIETDDFLAECSPRPFHLIKTVYEAFTSQPYSTPTPPPTTTRDPNATTLSTTTSTAAPTTTITFPTGSPGTHCTHPGNNPDNDDCRYFYQCVYDGTSYEEFKEECGEGSLFNPLSGICDYPASVCALTPPVCPNNCPVTSAPH